MIPAREPHTVFFMNEANNHAGLHGFKMQTTVYCIPLHTMEIICFYNMWTYGAKECFKRIRFSMLFDRGECYCVLRRNCTSP